MPPPLWEPVEQDPYLIDHAEEFMSDSEPSEEPGNDDISIGLLANIAIEYIKFGKHTSRRCIHPRALPKLLRRWGSLQDSLLT